MKIRPRIHGLLLAVPLLVAVIIVGAPSPASACSCAGEPLADRANLVAIAFSGRQTSRTVDDPVAVNGATLTFDVDTVYKGDVAETVAVRTPAQSSACGMDYGNIDQAAVVAHLWKGEAMVDLCGSMVTIDEMQAVFGPGVAPIQSVGAVAVDPDGNNLRIVVAAAAAVLVLGLATVAALRLRPATGEREER